MLQKVATGITIDGVVVGVIMYGVCHGVWAILKWFFNHLQTESALIIKTHVKSGHQDRLKHCFKDRCATPGTEPS